MRVHVSVDLEGVAGIATLDQVVRGGSGYPRAQELMTAEANAAVRGAFAGGATEVVVSDSHGTMDNLLQDRLDPRARLVLGAPRPSCMVQGLTARDDVVLLVGNHAAAGAPGVLSHTFSISFTEVRVNGSPVTEAEVNALYAASLGVPVGLLSGDDEVCAVARRVLPGARAVEVKRADGWAAAECASPARAAELLEEAAALAVARPPGPLAVPDELLLAVDFAVPLMADLAMSVPGSERVAGRTVQRAVGSADDLLRLVMAWYYLASLGAQQVAAVAHRR